MCISKLTLTLDVTEEQCEHVFFSPCLAVGVNFGIDFKGFFFFFIFSLTIIALIYNLLISLHH